MPADFSDYIDLRIFDLTPGDIYLTSIDIARLTLPEFNLRVGTPEDAIFQAMSYISSLNIAAINRIPDRLMAGILLMMGVVRQEGIPAEVELTLTAESYAGGSVAAGSLFSFEATFEDEIQEFVFETVDPVTIPESISYSGPYPTATVIAQCLTPGVIPVLNAGDSLSVISSGTPVLSAEVNGSFINGINEDTDSEYLGRAATKLRSLSETLNKASQVDAYLITDYSGVVGRVKTYDLTYGDSSLGEISIYRNQTPIGAARTSNVVTLYFSDKHQFVSGENIETNGLPSTFGVDGSLYTITDTSDYTISYSKSGTNSGSVYLGASTPSVSIGDDVSGYVTVFVYGLNQPVSSADKELIYVDLVSKSVAGLTYTVRDPNLLTLEISGTVVLDSTYDQTPLQNSVSAALINYLSPMNFPYNETKIRYTTLISIISSIPGVLYVDNLSLTGTGTGWLPKISNDIEFQYKGSLPSLAEEDISITYISEEV